MLPKRFWDKVTKTENCWVWTAGVNPQGYGMFNTGKRDNGSKICSLAHRVSFKDAHGYLPQQLDHVCSNKRCVRPDHLQPLDGRAHGRKSRAVQLGDQALEYWAQNRCAYGHDKTMRKDGRYYCNVCHAKAQRVYTQKQVV